MGGKGGSKGGTPSKAAASKAGTTLAKGDSSKKVMTEAAKTLAKVPDKKK
ncbi:MAG: hypothetical protein ABIR47_04505 [Candidatus Kapaibacterium sp.]